MPLLTVAVTVYSWLIVLRAILSWLQPVPEHPLRRALHTLTEPLLFPLRRVVPPRLLGGLDVSPVLAIIVLQGILWLIQG